MKLILALGGVLLLAACGSLPPQIAEGDSHMVCDRAQMDRAEARAQLTGVELHWVNCPQVRRDRVKTVS